MRPVPRAELTRPAGGWPSGGVFGWVLAAAGVLALGCSRDEAHAHERPPAPVSARPKASSQAQPVASQPAAPVPSAELADAQHPLRIPGDAGERPAATAQRVLHIGDSMVPLVGNYLRPIFWRDRRDYFIESLASSSTRSWANKRKLLDLTYKYDPDLIIISLGSNELFDPKPEGRAASIRQVVAETRGRPCLWIGPPAWKKDLGFISVLKKNLGHCRYFDSERIRLPRMEDGRHPSWSASYRWASEVWKAMGGSGDVPTGNANEP